MPTENNKTKLDDTKIPLHNSPTHTTTSTTTKKKDKKTTKKDTRHNPNSSYNQMQPKNTYHRVQIPSVSKADQSLIKAKPKTSTPKDKHNHINTPNNKAISTITPTTAFQRTNTENNKKTEKDITKENVYTPQQIQEENKEATEFLERENQEDNNTIYNIEIKNQFEHLSGNTPSTQQTYTTIPKEGITYSTTPSITNNTTTENIDFNKNNDTRETPTTTSQQSIDNNNTNDWKKVAHKKEGKQNTTQQITQDNNIEHKSNTNKSTALPQQVIIDNIITSLSQQEITTKTKEIFKERIKEIRYLKKGGMIITPSDHAGTSSLLQTDKYPSHIYGHNLYIHLTKDKTDTRPWLCINQVEYNKDTEHQTLTDIKNKINSIKNKLTNSDITIEGLHRKQKGPLQTTLLLFKTMHEIDQQTLTENKITHNNKSIHIRTYIDKSHTQCTNCQRIRHTHKQCKKEHACVRCSKTCPPNNCKSGALRKCVNCKGNHASTNKTCPVLKEHIKGLYENKKTQIYTDTLANQQKTMNKIQQSQENKITNISAHQTNIDQLQTIIKAQQQTIDRHNEEIKNLGKLINSLNITNCNQDKQINDTNKSLTAAMIKVNQQLTQINKNKETVSRDSIKHNLFHDNHNIIAECIYENKNENTKIRIKKTTQKIVNRITRDLKNPLISRINELENIQTTPNIQQQYEPIIDEQDNQAQLNSQNIEKTPDRNNKNNNV